MNNFLKKLKTKQDKGGFTIVETLVAITVLMIAIAGPLVVASKGLRAAVYARNQMIASYLAQESMEMIKNMRDNNFALNGPDHWLDLPYNISTCVRSGVGDTTTCDASAVDTNLVVTCAQAACPLYLVSDGYGHGSGSTNSGFSRYFYLTSVKAGVEVRATVVVSWNDGTVSNTVEISSELFNTSR